MGEDPPAEVLRLRPGAASWREVDGETVVLDVETSVYLGVNDSGTLLWRALATGATRDDLVASLCDAYDVDEHTAQRDVDAFIADCRAQQLLEP